MLIMNAILFILIIYLQLQINRLSNNNQENFDVTSDNLTAITNLGNLAGDILTKSALTIPVPTTISGGIFGKYSYLTNDNNGGNDAPLLIGSVNPTNTTSVNQWLFSTNCSEPKKFLNIVASNRNLDPTILPNAQNWMWNKGFQIASNGDVLINGDLKVTGKIFRADSTFY